MENGISRLRACHTIGARRRRVTSRGAMRRFAASGSPTAGEVLERSVGRTWAHQPRWPGAAYVGTFENEVIGIDMKARKVMWTYRHPERLFPGYCSSAAISQGRVVLGGRDEMIHALDAKTGEGSVDLHDQRARRILAGHRRQSRLCRLDRRPALSTRSSQRREIVGVRCGRRHHCVTGSREWQGHLRYLHDGRLYCLG